MNGSSTVWPFLSFQHVCVGSALPVCNTPELILSPFHSGFQCLFVFGPHWTGPIPTEIGQLQALTRLAVRNNQLTGIAVGGVCWFALELTLLSHLHLCIGVTVAFGFRYSCCVRPKSITFQPAIVQTVNVDLRQFESVIESCCDCCWSAGVGVVL